MPRYKYKQSNPRSCGAATAMVAMAELGVIGTTRINVDTEVMIWRNVWAKRHGDESRMAYIVNLFIGNDLSAQLYEDERIISDLIQNDMRLTGPFHHHKRNVESTGLNAQKNPILREHFTDNARIILVVMDAFIPVRHCLLARQEGQEFWIMDPGSGCDIQQPDLFQWLNGNQRIANIGRKEYIFTGIFVRVLQK